MRTWAPKSFTVACLLGAGLCGVVARATDGTRDFARYQIILDRAPVGAMAGSGADVQQPSFSTRFTFIGTAQEGNEPLMAIVMEKDGNANRVHFVATGAKMGPVTVVKIEKADKSPAKLVLKQDLEVATLLMDSKGGGGPSLAPAPGSPASPFMQGGQPTVPMIPQPGARRIPFARGISK